MLRYKITTPEGHSITCDMNEAAALMEVERGNRVELLGRSLVKVVSE